MKVLTGRYVAICRFAREHGLRIVESEMFAPHVRPGAMD